MRARTHVSALELMSLYLPPHVTHTQPPCTGFRDHCVYEGRQVFLYKRAQILVADVWGAYGRRVVEKEEAATAGSTLPLGAFHDIHRLTMFGAWVFPHRGMMRWY